MVVKQADARPAQTTHRNSDSADQELALHIEQGADLAVLLMTVAHTTGDLSVLRPEWRPVDVLGAPRCEVSPEEQARIRRECIQRLRDHRAAAGQTLTRPNFDLVRGIGEWVMGNAVEPYVPLLAEELVVDGDDLRRPQWTKATIAPQRPFHVAIVGAGESGIIAALRLKQAGVPFTIYEKNPDVGGTWLDNNYPGCRVDINSFVYSYASAMRIWSDYFGTQQEVLDYLQQFAKENGLYEHIRFGAEVTETAWDEQGNSWKLAVRSEGKVQEFRANMLVFAVGQLNRPKLPELPGVEKFAGVSFHSARWDHSVDMTGKKVGVIGTGASAFQFVPQVAAKASKVSVFARTAPWLLPTPNLHLRVEGSTRWLLENLPGYAQWYRASLFMCQAPGLLDQVIVDKTYPADERAVSAANAATRQQLQGWLEPQISDRPDLRDVVIPKSPVGAKRMLRDNGTWVSTLKRDNVEVIKARIDEITERGIQCDDGAHHEFDVILYGTGFNASKFLFPIVVKGIGGVNLTDRWQDGPRAYLGMTVPQFPNMFCMYGPNTNLVVHGASIVLFSELTAKYIVDAARVLLETGEKKMDVREDVFAAYNRRVDDANRERAWGHSKVNSWYKDASGRVTQNYPFSTPEFFQRTHAVVAADFHFGSAR